MNKSSKNINISNKNIFSLLNKNLNKKDNKNNKNDQLDFQIKNSEKEINYLKEQLTKLLEEKEKLKNQKGNLLIEISKQNSKIESYKNQISNNNNNKIISNIISDKDDKDTSWRSIHDSGIFDVSL
jgi:chromosome segregation ATPase